MASGKFDMSDYVPVADRVAQFFHAHPEGCLQPWCPPWVETVGGHQFLVYAAAAYRTPDDPRPGVGTAWEPVPGTTPYTRGNEMQNAETSAWGRAILAVGAADARRGIASRDEVQNSRAREGASEPARPPLPTSWKAATDLYDRLVGVEGALAEWVGLVAQAEYGAAEAAELTKEQKDATFRGVRSVVQHLIANGADVDTVGAAWDAQFPLLAQTGWEPAAIVADGEKPPDEPTDGTYE